MQNKKYIKIAGLLLLFTLIVVIIFDHKKAIPQAVSLGCPDDYKTAEEATAAMNTWTNNFFDTHPGASLTDWGNARYQFYIDHNCTAAIARYKQAQAGKADPATMNAINQGINAALNH